MAVVLTDVYQDRVATARKRGQRADLRYLEVGRGSLESEPCGENVSFFFHQISFVTPHLPEKCPAHWSRNAERHTRTHNVEKETERELARMRAPAATLHQLLDRDTHPSIGRAHYAPFFGAYTLSLFAGVNCPCIFQEVGYFCSDLLPYILQDTTAVAQPHTHVASRYFLPCLFCFRVYCRRVVVRCVPV